MGKKKCPECPPEGAPGWMVTYGDLMTLLLCFFVLLFSFSTISQKKFESLKESMRGAFGALSGQSTTMGTGVARKPPTETDKSFDQAVSKLLVQIKQKPPKERLEILEAALLKANEALRMVSVEKSDVVSLVDELENPAARKSGSPNNTSTVQEQVEEREKPRNRPEKLELSGATDRRKEQDEMTMIQMYPQKASGENIADPLRSDATKTDVAPGRDHNLEENTGQQKQQDKLTGKMKPKKRSMDKVNRRAEDKDYASFREPKLKDTIREFVTLSGMVRETYSDANVAVLQLNDELLFEKNSVELREQAKEVVFKMFMDFYKKDSNAVFQIEGHTDRDFTPSIKYPTVWHIAAARANAILKFLLDESDRFEPDRFSVVSFGSYQPKYRYRKGQKRLQGNSRLEVRMFQKP
jgi:chemotaxis protein MotB